MTTTKRAAIGLALSAAAAVVLSARADQPVNLGVDMGLWQLTTQAQVSGVLSPELQQKLQSLPPDQRARIQAAMQAAMAAAQREHVFEDCMTPKRWSRGIDSGDHSAQCKSTLVSNTRTDFEYRRICTPPDGNGHTETAHFHMLDPHHVSGTVEVVQTGGGHPTTIHETVAGKWLGSSCGSVKDSQVVK
jgi:Protein of unknown function (DUF3617)